MDTTTAGLPPGAITWKDIFENVVPAFRAVTVGQLGHRLTIDFTSEANATQAAAFMLALGEMAVPFDFQKAYSRVLTPEERAAYGWPESLPAGAARTDASEG